MQGTEKTRRQLEAHCMHSFWGSNCLLLLSTSTQVKCYSQWWRRLLLGKMMAQGIEQHDALFQLVVFLLLVFFFFFFFLLYCVCVCVCVWERERERERELWCFKIHNGGKKNLLLWNVAAYLYYAPLMSLLCADASDDASVHSDCIVPQIFFYK